MFQSGSLQICFWRQSGRPALVSRCGMAHREHASVGCAALLLYICFLIACFTQYVNCSFVVQPKLTPPKEKPLRYLRKEVLNATELLDCDYRAPTKFDAPATLSHLYGDGFNPAKPGRGAIFVFGNHNTGTSMLSRLLMLMGAFQGNLARLSTSPKNRLKYWEMLDVSHMHDLLLARMSDRAFKPYHAQGFDITAWSRDAQDKLDCFIDRVYEDLERHEPWLMKDPRMLWFASHWVRKVDSPVCVVAYRDPVENAISLASNAKKSAELNGHKQMTAKRWLDAWEQGMISVLYACKGHPTFVHNAHDMQVSPMKFINMLFNELSAAGVSGLQLPSMQRVKSEFLSFLKHARPESEADQSVLLTPSQMLLDDALRHAQQSVHQQPDDTVPEMYAADAILSELDKRGYADMVQFKLWGMPR